MKIKAKSLKVGTIMMSGEKVTSVKYSPKRLSVILQNQKTESCRQAQWGLNSTLMVKSVPETV